MKSFIATFKRNGKGEGATRQAIDNLFANQCDHADLLAAALSKVERHEAAIEVLTERVSAALVKVKRLEQQQFEETGETG